MAFTARTPEAIFDGLLTAKSTIPELTGLTTTINDAQELLDGLQSDSKVSRWVLYLYVWAQNIWALEKIMEKQVDEVEAIRDSSFVGTPDWYAFIATQFQYGDQIQVNASTEYIPKYAIEDDTKRIVEHVAADEGAGTLRLKIRGRDADLLTQDELNAFIAYMNKVKFAGTRLAIQNDPADNLKLIATVKYNGEADKGTVQAAVEAAINNYLLNIEFNSELVVNTLIDRVQAVSGVVDMEINTIEGKTASTSYAPIVHRYKAGAGYMRVDSNYPLSTFLTYTIEK